MNNLSNDICRAVLLIEALHKNVALKSDLTLMVKDYFVDIDGADTRQTINHCIQQICTEDVSDLHQEIKDCWKQIYELNGDDQILPSFKEQVKNLNDTIHRVYKGQIFFDD